MFGFSKKQKLNAKHTKFTEDLAAAASAYQFGISYLDSEAANTFMEQSLNHYFEQDPKFADYTACDYFLSKFSGAIMQAFMEEDATLEWCTDIFFATDHFLQGYGIYQTEKSMEIMSVWQMMLDRRGAFDNIG